jgi:multiple antibiotic resistance protein
MGDPVVIFVSFLKSLALVPLTLLPIINPLGGAPVFIATAGTNPLVVRKMARRVAINSWYVLVVSMLVGTYVLEVFGISLQIVRLGGGLMLATAGWRLLGSRGGNDVQKAVVDQNTDLSDAEIAKRSFFPITFPLTTGPGAIAASIALGVHLPRTPVLYLAGATIAVVGVAFTAFVVYLCYRNAAKVLSMLGEVGSMVIMRMFAFILLCIGIEIMWAGWAALNHIAS